MDFTAKKVERIIDALKESIVIQTQEMDGFIYISSDYTQDNIPPAFSESWIEYPKAGRVGGKDGHYWFYKKFHTPAPQHGKKLFFRLDTSAQGDWDAGNPQSLVILNGNITQGIDINHRLVPLEPDTDYELYLYYYVGMIDYLVEVLPSLQWRDCRIESLYYDLSVPFDVCKCYHENDDDYVCIMRELHNAVQLLDLRQIYSEAFYSSVSASIEYLEKNLYQKYSRENGPVVNCIGHTHIDVAWLWTLAQTREKAQRSFSTVINMMKQYPEYKFMSSQPQLYQYVKNAAPSLYEEIKQAVAEGRWEVEGAMWLEADCNLTSGESLVRQIMHGKRFMKEEFGVDSNILWLPDVFGYSAALPQILKKSGINKFVTSKISWNESNRMPYDTFMWQGIDGTEIFTYFITAQDSNKKGSEPENYTTYVCYIRPSQVLGTWERYQPKGYNNETIMTFGYGDGGGGPTCDMLEQQRRLSRGLPGLPRTQISTISSFLDRVEQNFKNGIKTFGDTPRWVGELYLELHRGTYTTMAHNKRCNRKSEQLYQMVETVSSAAAVMAEFSYPQAELNSGWETILLNQFHDIIPGSSIREVYEDSAKQYEDVLYKGKKMFDCALKTIVENINTDGGMLIYNPNPFVYNGEVKCNDDFFVVSDIPALGWKVVKPVSVQNSINVSKNKLENRYYTVLFDENGEITSVFDKEANRELVKFGETLNQLRVYEDYPYSYDAWDISPYYRDKMFKADQLDSISLLDEGGRAGLELIRTYQRSKIIQRIYLYENSRRIDFVTDVDWNEDHVVLKAAFPLDIHATEAMYEIQFGSVKRPLHRNTSWDAAKFEVCAHKWADVSEEDYGVSLLNDCKYGHSNDGTTMMLTLLRASTDPNPVADRGHHTFTYALYPHMGCLGEDTVQEAYRLNRQITALEVKAQSGCLPDVWSLVHTDCPHVIIDTVKCAEDGNGLIVRMYESGNRRANATLTFGFEIEKAELCNLLEQDGEIISIDKNKVTVSFKPFEIITLRVINA